jgi:type I pantothenate kinase
MTRHAPDELTGFEPVADAIRELVRAAAGSTVLVGIAGSVCVGKSAAGSRIRQLLEPISAEVITTDGFLYPNAELAARGIAERKGFPESYDAAAIREVLSRIRAGAAGVSVPLYSHETYDVVPDERYELTDAAVVVVDGVNALRFADELDLRIYIDAPIAAIREWYRDRIVQVFRDAPPGSFYFGWGLDEAEQRAFGDQIWESINVPNLREWIEPTRAVADIVVEKGADHRVERVLFPARS